LDHSFFHSEMSVFSNLLSGFYLALQLHQSYSRPNLNLWMFVHLIEGFDD